MYLILRGQLLNVHLGPLYNEKENKRHKILCMSSILCCHTVNVANMNSRRAAQEEVVIIRELENN